MALEGPVVDLEPGQPRPRPGRNGRTVIDGLSSVTGKRAPHLHEVAAATHADSLGDGVVDRARLGHPQVHVAAALGGDDTERSR